MCLYKQKDFAVFLKKAFLLKLAVNYKANNFFINGPLRTHTYLKCIDSLFLAQQDLNPRSSDWMTSWQSRSTNSSQPEVKGSNLVVGAAVISVMQLICYRFCIYRMKLLEFLHHASTSILTRMQSSSIFTQSRCPIDLYCVI